MQADDSTFNLPDEKQANCPAATDVLEDLPVPEEMRANLDKQLATLCSTFKHTKLQKEAGRNWDRFYNRHGVKFFKDRHWTKREFIDLSQISEDRDAQVAILEIGCGVGNFIFPLIEDLNAERKNPGTLGIPISLYILF